MTDKIRVTCVSDVVELLPILIGIEPTESIVATPLMSPGAPIMNGDYRPDVPLGKWLEFAADSTEKMCGSGDVRSAAVVVYSDPEEGKDGLSVGAEAAPFIEVFADAFKQHGAELVFKACVSGERWWCINCEDPHCSHDPDGYPMPGVGRVTAEAAFAGKSVVGESTRDVLKRWSPIEDYDAEKVSELVRAAAERLHPTDNEGSMAELWRAFECADQALREGNSPDEETAYTLIVGCVVKENRDELLSRILSEPASWERQRRLWESLIPLCVEPHRFLRCAPLVILALVELAGGREVFGRLALKEALETDPKYLMAQLLHGGLNEGLKPSELVDAVRFSLITSHEREDDDA
ncbi:DUF4192 domain-containing protein [Streptomyces smyrnaeus]|uniref:DUF4192 domain-containing protein n=1 Tax=Streptomyces smyrnaeus TaxID=1387713 RepID=A0ABS3Y6M9_9ACTN|nr:DUF4192 domain-containing protein [Streptomyces smyrnaeus]MBO8203138.1 DUF4192 domain-containing protein [Streptomyces smyrnaeus]